LRKLAIVTLVAVPVADVAWVVHQGLNPPPPERLPAAGKPAPSASGSPPASAQAAAAGKPADADAALLALFDGLLGPGEQARLYDSNGLFDYIDGGAPVFIERGFRASGRELKLEARRGLRRLRHGDARELHRHLPQGEVRQRQAVEGWPRRSPER
jgi:hypothetical protein